MDQGTINPTTRRLGKKDIILDSIDTRIISLLIYRIV
jgi:hypothetical protein